MRIGPAHHRREGRAAIDDRISYRRPCGGAHRLNTVTLTAIQTTAFLLAFALSLRRLARKGAPVVRAILAAGLAAGTCMHLVDLVERGPLGSPHQPLAFNVFWTSLSVLDPLGALLLS